METKTITALKQQKRNPNRVNLYLDGEFAFGLQKIVAAWLKVGQQLDPERIHSLQNQDAIEAAYQRGLHFISYRPRSIQETRQRLLKKEIDPIIIDAVIERLVEKKHLDDADFAQQWVENRSAFKPRSRFALRGELIKKGISESDTQIALRDVDDTALAIKAAEARAHRLSRHEWKEFHKKLAGFLGRRGFSYAIANEVCRELWKQLQNETQNA